MTRTQPICPLCGVPMFPIEDEEVPHLPTFLCYDCGSHPNTVLMEDELLYLAYQGFYARFRDILKPKITQSATGLEITRRFNRIP